MSKEPAKAGCTIGLPQNPAGAGGSTAAPEVLAEAEGSTIVPQVSRGASPFAQEQGVGSKWPCPDEVEQGSGGSPPNVSTAQRR